MLVTRYRKALRLWTLSFWAYSLLLASISLYCIYRSQHFTQAAYEIQQTASKDAETAVADGNRYESHHFDREIASLDRSANDYRMYYRLLWMFQIVSSSLVLAFGPSRKVRVSAS